MTLLSFAQVTALWCLCYGMHDSLPRVFTLMKPSFSSGLATFPMENDLPLSHPLSPSRCPTWVPAFSLFLTLESLFSHLKIHLCWSCLSAQLDLTLFVCLFFETGISSSYEDR